MLLFWKYCTIYMPPLTLTEAASEAGQRPITYNPHRAASNFARCIVSAFSMISVFQLVFPLPFVADSGCIMMSAWQSFHSTDQNVYLSLQRVPTGGEEYNCVPKALQGKNDAACQAEPETSGALGDKVMDSVDGTRGPCNEHRDSEDK